jgi:hypothetical protein
VAGQRGWQTWPSTGADLEMPRPRVSLRLDQYQPFVGRQSALVAIEDEAQTGQRYVAGISQGDIAVRSGQALAFEMYVRGAGPAGSRWRRARRRRARGYGTSLGSQLVR